MPTVYGYDLIGQYSFRLPIPPAPERMTADSTHCPICHKDMHSPSAVSVSGWVYCYRCIANYIRAEGKCPVSGLSATLDDVIKIYS